MDYRGGLGPVGEHKEEATLYHSGQGSKWKAAAPLRASSLERMQDPARVHGDAIPPGVCGVAKNLHLVGLGAPSGAALSPAPWASRGLLLVQNQVP